jgi:hypothetical protein
VANIHSGMASTGGHAHAIGEGLPAGLYLVRLAVDGNVSTQRLVIGR